MPKKFYKKPTKKRYTKKRYNRRYKSRAIVRSIGVPKARFVKLRWAAHYSWSLSALAGATAEFKINSMYDPVAAVGGTQPYYFDQYAAMYGRYRVYGCKIRIIAAAQSSGNAVWPTILMFGYCDHVPGWGTNMDVASCNKGSVLKMIPLNQNKVVLSKYFNLAALAGISKREYDTSEPFQAYCTADPSRTMRASIWVQNNDASLSITPQYWIHMTYYAKFFDPIEPAGS